MYFISIPNIAKCVQVDVNGVKSVPTTSHGNFKASDDWRGAVLQLPLRRTVRDAQVRLAAILLKKRIGPVDVLGVKRKAFSFQVQGVRGVKDQPLHVRIIARDIAESDEHFTVIL